MREQAELRTAVEPNLRFLAQSISLLMYTMVWRGHNEKEIWYITMTKTHNQYIGYRIYDAQKSTSRSLEVALKPYGITPGQWNLLNQLDNLGKLSQRALAERTRKEQATITRYLDKLEKREFIQREQDPHDRRAHVISLTAKAKTLLRETESAANEAALCLIKDIPQKRIDSFLETLQLIKQNADNFIEENNGQ